jgi:transposase-like protein
MGKARFSDDFKLDAIKQITERGYSVADVSQRLGVSTHSLYGWVVSSECWTDSGTPTTDSGTPTNC